MATADSLRDGDDVLVRGRVQKVFIKEGLAEITFSDWWPPWSAVLVKVEQVATVPASPSLGDRRRPAGAPGS